MLQSFLSKGGGGGGGGGHLRGIGGGIAGLWCRVQVLFGCPRSAGEMRVALTLGHLPWCDFLKCREGLRVGLLPSDCPHRVGLIPGL